MDAAERDVPKGYRALFRLPMPRRLALVSLPADFADWVDYAAVIALLVFAWGEGPLTLAFFALALSLPYVAIGPFLAVLTDRISLRSMLVVTNLGRAVVTTGFIFAGSTVVVILLVFLRATVDSAFGPARQSAIQASTPKPMLAEANGLHHAINQVSKIVGPALGGVLVGVIPLQAVFGFNAALSLIAAAISATLVIQREPESEHVAPIRFIRRVSAGIETFIRNGALRLALIFVATAFFAFFLYDALIALITDEFGLGPTAFGLSIGASGAGGLVGALIAGRFASKRPFRLMSLSAAVGGIVPILLGFAALASWPVDLPVFLLALSLMGGGAGFLTVPYRTVVQSETPPDRIARVIAAGEAVTVVVMLAAPFIGSAIAELFGTGAAFVFGGSILVTLGAVVLLRRPRVAV